MATILDYARYPLRKVLGDLEQVLDADMLSITSPILPGLAEIMRTAIEQRQPRRTRLAILLDTEGGVVEVAERAVQVMRHFYDHVTFVIARKAMSAGTVLVMSGDRILMDYFSCLGPIDPQLEQPDGTLIPVLGYLDMYRELVEKSKRGELTTAEYGLVTSQDLARLRAFEEARELSLELLTNWLSQYKFRDWKETDGSRKTVTDEMRRERAKEIAQKLSDNRRWHSHGRPIHMGTLVDELNLRIDDFGADERLSGKLRDYSRLQGEYMRMHGLRILIHDADDKLFYEVRHHHAS